MSDRERLLEEIAAGQRNVRFGELLKLMDHWGFDARTMQRGGHGVVFQHRSYRRIRVTIARPKGGQKMKVCYVKDCMDAIDWVSEMEGSTHG